jgi:translocation and assembly module TamB
MRAAYAALALACMPMLAHSQTGDRDYLTALLEDNLSGAGRQVVITGFQGALSSQARISELTIADDLGVWIALKDVTLDWTRSDLLLGKVTVNTLSAAEITLARLPQSDVDISAEAAPFSLPELPISVNIGRISAQTLHLGAPVLGQAVTANVTASLQLSGGQGRAEVAIERLDANAPDGSGDLKVSFDNSTRQLSVDVDISEGQGGILAGVMGIEGAPSLEFSAKGEGPMADFMAQVELRADGAQRLAGFVQLTSTAQSDAPIVFSAQLSGDLAPLVAPKYRPFFGARTELRATGKTRTAGGFDLDSLSLSSQSMQVSGNLSVAASGIPSRFDLHGKVKSVDGAPLVLPLGLRAPAVISTANVQASFDSAQGDSWQMQADLAGWSQADLRIGAVQIVGSGRLRDTGKGAQMSGAISVNAEGVLPARASTLRALGTVLWGGGDFNYQDGTLNVSNMALHGEDYQISLDGELGQLAQGLVFSGEAVAKAADFARFADVIGQSIAGAGALRYSGNVVLLTGAFEGVLQADTQNLAFGIQSVDAALKGDAAITLKGARGAQGIDIEALTARATGANLNVAGEISQGNVALNGDFELLDMPIAARGFGGQVAGEVMVLGTLQNAVATVSARASAIDFSNPYLQKLAAADTDFTAEVSLINLSPSLRKAALHSSLLHATIDAAAQTDRYEIDIGLSNMAAVLPQFPGQLSLNGSADLLGDGAVLDIALAGPAGLAAKLVGQASLGQSNNLRLSGRADAGLMNAFITPRSVSGDSQFDLKLRGGAALSGVSGTLNIAKARLADPALPFSLQDVSTNVTWAGQQMAVQLSANVTTGGSIAVSGTVSPIAPYPADLKIDLRNLGLQDPDFYQSSATGTLTLTGPVTGGASLGGTVDLGRTEVQLRPTETAFASLQGLQHVGDTPEVRASRARAGFDLPGAARASSRPMALDITVRALNRLFVRGRGLDAELGGEVRLQGSTNDVRPTGAFDLVRGRFDILTKRLDLEEVRLEMQGQLIPYLSVRATNLRGGITTSVIVDGPASDPEFTFTSFPEMPQEDILSELLFDQNLQGLSVLQAVQLTSAVATLTGRGDGVVGRIRRMLALDNLDMQTDESGKTALKLGKYVADDVYSELSSDSSGEQALDFTYTLNSKIKLRAGGQTNGNVGVGIEIETNY